MTDLAPLMQGFFTDRLMRQRQASPDTVAGYRDTMKLLLAYLGQRTGRSPERLTLADLDAAAIAAFLQHLEADRGNTASTRNTRLAAIHSFFHYAALHAPDQAALIARVLAIPAKRTSRPSVSYLTAVETDALLTAPDQTTWHGRRDHALLLIALHTGLRVSELTALTHADVQLSHGPYVRCHGKGRKDRCTPLTPSAASTLRAWLKECGGHANDPVFPTRRGGRLSRDAVELLVRKHAKTAAEVCPTLARKKITPHTLRHSNAMALLHANVDTSIIALWLGHESPQSTQPYLHADMTLKRRALARITQPEEQPPRYTARDTLLAFLESL